MLKKRNFLTLQLTMFDVGMLTQLPCQYKRSVSAGAGALVAYQGLDRLLPLPPIVHYAAGGVAVDALCRGRDVMKPTQEVAISAAAGIAGAYLAGVLLGRGPRF